MENENVMTVEAVTSVQKPKHKWLEKGSKLAKKAVLAATVMSSTATMCTTQAFAATGYSEDVRYFQDYGSRMYFMKEM